MILSADTNYPFFYLHEYYYTGTWTRRSIVISGFWAAQQAEDVRGNRDLHPPPSCLRTEDLFLFLF